MCKIGELKTSCIAEDIEDSLIKADHERLKAKPSENPSSSGIESVVISKSFICRSYLSKLKATHNRITKEDDNKPIGYRLLFIFFDIVNNKYIIGSSKKKEYSEPLKESARKAKIIKKDFLC
jgi:hypothetical protein